MYLIKEEKEPHSVAVASPVKKLVLKLPLSLRLIYAGLSKNMKVIHHMFPFCIYKGINQPSRGTCTT